MAVTLAPRLDDHVDVGIDAAVARIAAADFQDSCGAPGLVDQMVAVRGTGLEGSTVAGMRVSSPTSVKRVSSPSTTQTNSSSWLCQ